METGKFERVDMRIPDYERTWSEISRSSSLCFKINHTNPMEESSRSLVRELIPGMPESSHIMPPMQIDMGANVKIGNYGGVLMHKTILIEEITIENVTEKINEKVQEMEKDGYQVKTMSFWGTDKVVLIFKKALKGSLL